MDILVYIFIHGWDPKNTLSLQGEFIQVLIPTGDVPEFFQHVVSRGHIEI